MKGCNCGIDPPQRIIDMVKETTRLVESGEYRTLNLAALSDEDFELWMTDRAAFGEYHGYTITDLPHDKRLRALVGK